MTSNLGSEIIQQNFEDLDHKDLDTVMEATRNDVYGLLRQTIRPEFLNRIDETILFTPLNKADVKEIVGLQLNGVIKLAKKNQIELSVSEEVVDYLSEIGYDPQFGARPIKRVIQKKVLNQLSKDLLAGKVSAGDVVVMDVFEDEVVFRQPLEDEIKSAIES